jgi:hypothetical protein
MCVFRSKCKNNYSKNRSPLPLDVSARVAQMPNSAFSRGKVERHLSTSILKFGRLNHLRVPKQNKSTLIFPPVTYIINLQEFLKTS